MIAMVSGISAGSPSDLMTMNLPRRSILASTVTFIGGSAGISPRPCHSPISGSNSFIAAHASLGPRLRADDVGAGDLVVPALLLRVESGPDDTDQEDDA